MKININNFKVSSGSPISDAMYALNKGGGGICFVVSGDRLVGLVTDGDIRRAFLGGCNLDSDVDLAMTKDFFSLPVGTTLHEIQNALLSHKHIPIIDENGKIVDLATNEHYHQIVLVEPLLNGNELEYVTDCISAGWISSQGKYVRQFENVFGQYVGCPNTLAVSNGTVALHLALLALGIGPGDEVIVPDLTFAAPVNAICYIGATPVLVDVEPISMAIDPTLIEELITEHTKAIIVVHLYGQPADMDKVEIIAKKYGLKIIEDCAEALGSLYQGRHVGQFGDAATFSFFGNKTITTGEGGMLVLKDPSVLERARILRDHGMSPERRYWHEEIGFNYRLTNLQAAVGVAQLERVDQFVERKRCIANQYKSHLLINSNLSLPSDWGDVRNSFWLFTMTLINGFERHRDGLLNFLKLNGIESRPVFYPIHQMPPYKKYIRPSDNFHVSLQLSAAGISLPSSVTISESEVSQVCHLVNKFLDSAK